MNLKIILAASALALLVTGGARAADAVVEEPPPAPEIPVFTWTGFYVGIQGGYAWTNVDVDPGGFGIDDLNGGLFGGYVGYNWQHGPWVFGAEGDFNGVWNDQTFDVGGALPFSTDIGTDWLASIRARAGYSFDRALVFATGGVAFTQASADTTFAGGLTFGGDETFTGWTVGGGLEYAFTDNWLGRAEYRYYGFPDKDLDGTGGLGSVSLDTQTLTVGIAYKF
jgi:outer membrane immunogenic protein